MKVFLEVQKFTQVWLHILMWFSFSIPMFFVSYEWFTDRDNNNDSLVGLIVVLVAFGLTYGFILSLKLKTRIYEKGVSFRFIPFHFNYKFISWDKIDKAYVRKYDAISDYGGWGLKGGKLWDKNKGIAYNVKGNIGLQLELKNGKKILIGTQKEAELTRVLSNYIKPSATN